ncbi:hypothetical protein GCM10010271_15170 [Streptomyces kurssanovii]|nr:hypothetical protein GCM10010271_15170 [Streptomyces kurssanovii]
MNIPWLEIAGFSAAALSALAALGSWKAARRANATSARAQATGERAYEVAELVARIERDRWHADLLPQFRIALERETGDRATLSVRLVGPLPLCHLDEIRIAVVASDDYVRAARLPGGPSQDELDAQVWGPFRFTHGADGADVNGQTVEPFSLQVGAGRPFSMERTRPPHWQEGQERDAHWRNQWTNTPIRLIATCTREGFKPWVVPCEVEVPGSTRVSWV